MNENLDPTVVELTIDCLTKDDCHIQLPLSVSLRVPAMAAKKPDQKWMDNCYRPAVERALREYASTLMVAEIRSGSDHILARMSEIAHHVYHGLPRTQ